MGLHTVPMRMFLTTMEKWVKAVEQQKMQDAVFFVQQLHAAAELLAIDPEFRRLFHDHRNHCDVNDPATIIGCLYAFLHAVTDASQPGRFRDGDEDQPRRH